jgi:hypothetical protein
MTPSGTRSGSTLPARTIIRIAALCGLVVATSARATSQAPLWQTGQWTAPVYSWGLQPTHVLTEISHGILLLRAPGGPKVMLLAHDNSAFTNAYLFDPNSPIQLMQIASPSPTSDIFCSGHTFRADGTLVVCGGFPIGAGGFVCNPTPPATPLANFTFGFDPVALTWTGVPTFSNMGASRFYPSVTQVTTHPNVVPGGPLVIGGTEHEFCPYCKNLPPCGSPAKVVSPGPPPVYDDVDKGYIAGWETHDATTSVWTARQVPNPANPYLLFPASPPTGPWHTRWYPHTYLLSGIPERIIVAGDTHATFEYAHQPCDSSQFPYSINPTTDPGCFAYNVLDRTLMLTPSFPNANGALTPTTTVPAHLAALFPGTSMTVLPRYFASSALLHTLDQQNRVLRFGGSFGTYKQSFVLSDVEEWDDAQLTWVKKSTSLVFPRVFQNAVVLPDRSIFVVGGYANDNDNNPGVGQNPQLTPEVYDPGATTSAPGATSTVAATITPRGYHSVACLLPDGRVLSAGGETIGPNPSADTGEIYSPGYFFRGLRPTIQKPIPTTLTYGTTSVLTVAWSVATQQAPTNRVVLMRPASMTHHFDFDQRYVELQVVSAVRVGSNWQLTVQTPANMQLIPPGDYMLWVVEQVTNATGTYWAPAVTSATVRVQ